MRIAVLTKKENPFVHELCTALGETGHEAVALTPEFAAAKNEDWDAYLLKTKREDFLTFARTESRKGSLVVPEPGMVERMRRRNLRDEFLNKNGIPCPPSAYATVHHFMANPPPDQFFPAVAKPLMSSGGLGLRIIEAVRDLIPADHPEKVYLQKLVHGTHYVVFFIGEKTWAFEKETHIGPDIEPTWQVPVWPALEKVVETYKRETSFSWGKIDVVDTKEGLFCVDCGSFPSFNGIDPHLAAKAVVTELLPILEKSVASESERVTVSSSTESRGNGGPCKKCVKLMAMAAMRKSVTFHIVHVSFVYAIRLLLTYHRLKIQRLYSKQSTCNGCPKVAKNALKQRSSLFRWLNSRLDPWFDTTLEGLITQEDMEEARKFAAGVGLEG